MSFNPSQVQFTLEYIKENERKRTKFQSLTGSIHTLECLITTLSSPTVSIPHRFNSHLKGFQRVKYCQLSFNPSQVQFTRGRGILNQLQFQCFNPSQVQFTHIEKLKTKFKVKSFNPSQVQFTLDFGVSPQGRWFCFNPSQVQFTPVI